MNFTRFLLGSAALGTLCLPTALADSPWKTLTTPDGFAMSAPAGWTITSQRGARIVAQSPDHTELALVQPFTVSKGKAGSRAILTALLPQMSAQLPQAAIVRTKPVADAPDETAAQVTYAAAGGPGRAGVICSVAGGAGMFFAIAAPQDSFAAETPTLLKVVNSFHTAPPSQAQAPASGGDAPNGLTFTTWRDPREGAFTNLVPVGWKATGGTFRFSISDLRPQLNAVSPDGQTQIQLGDSTIPPFSLPNPNLARRGLGPNSWNVLPNGEKSLILNYRTGAELSRDIVQNVWARRLQNVQIISTEDLPAPPDPTKVPGARTTKGMTTFTFEHDGQTLNGVVRTGTLLLPFPNGQPGGSWFCLENGEGIGPQPADQLLATITYMQQSRKWNPTWLAKNKKASDQETQQSAKAVTTAIARSRAHAAATSPESRMSHAQFMQWMAYQQRERNARFRTHMAQKEADHIGFMQSEFPGW